jgi:pimeloyl-ACP methyl ester carboxylesterase
MAVRQCAASIDVEEMPRPPHLSPGFLVPAGVTERYMSIRAIDGNVVPAALLQPASPASTEIAGTVVISVHGSAGSYDTDPNGFLAMLLAERGWAVLGIDTRQSRSKVNTDNLMDVRRDIEAAVYTARSLGFTRIVLHGHSLGNMQVQFFAATCWDRDLIGVVLTGMFANLPWKSRHMLVQDEPAWARLQSEALAALAAGKHDQILPSPMGWFTGERVPVSAQHFLSYRAEASSAAIGTFWIARVPHPILMVRDDGDQVVAPFEPINLLSAARVPGSLVPSIEYVRLPNPKGPNPRGHSFSDNRRELADTVAGWLATLGSRTREAAETVTS